MASKKFIYFGAFVGGIIGGYLPTLWGDSALSGMSLLLGFIGSLLGIWAAFVIGKNYG